MEKEQRFFRGRRDGTAPSRGTAPIRSTPASEALTVGFPQQHHNVRCLMQVGVAAYNTPLDDEVTPEEKAQIMSGNLLRLLDRRP